MSQRSIVFLHSTLGVLLKPQYYQTNDPLNSITSHFWQILESFISISVTLSKIHIMKFKKLRLLRVKVIRSLTRTNILVLLIKMIKVIKMVKVTRKNENENGYYILKS